MKVSPVIFETLPSGRVVAKLGHNIIGEAREWDAGRKTRAYWRCVLPMPDGTAPTAMPKGAASLDVATWALKRAIEEWFEAAGPAFEPVVRALRMEEL